MSVRKKKTMQNLPPKKWAKLCPAHTCQQCVDNWIHQLIQMH